jgi:hypothetical protein
VNLRVNERLLASKAFRSRTQSVVSGVRGCRTSNSAFPQLHFQMQVRMFSSVINRSIHQQGQGFIQESKHSLYTEDCRLQGLDPLKLYLLFIYAFTCIYSTYRLMILQSHNFLSATAVRDRWWAFVCTSELNCGSAFARAHIPTKINDQ